MLATWASFYSLVPKAYSKEDLAATGGRGSPNAQSSGPSYNHPIHGYNKPSPGPNHMNASAVGPQGAMYGGAPSAPRYYDDAA